MKNPPYLIPTINVLLGIIDDTVLADSQNFFGAMLFSEAAALADLALASERPRIAADIMLSWAQQDSESDEWLNELLEYGVIYEQHNDGEGQWVYTEDVPRD